MRTYSSALALASLILCALFLTSAQAQSPPQARTQPPVFVAQVAASSTTSATADTSASNAPAASAAPQGKEEGPTPEQNSLQRKLLFGLMVLLLTAACVYLRRKRSAGSGRAA